MKHILFLAIIVLAVSCKEVPTSTSYSTAVGETTGANVPNEVQIPSSFITEITTLPGTSTPIYYEGSLKDGSFIILTKSAKTDKEINDPIKLTDLKYTGVYYQWMGKETLSHYVEGNGQITYIREVYFTIQTDGTLNITKIGEWVRQY